MIAVLVGGFGLTPGFAADAVPRAELLASMCATCHGTNGTGAKPNPSINGEDPADFADIMQAFASGDEPTSIMDRHAQGYTEAEIKMLADYFSKQ
jgi:sulfide dehydrogenase cytochrome subunit